MTFMEWYDKLDKPSWTPEPSTIGSIWSILYPIIIAVNIWVTLRYFQNKLPLSVALPVWLNLVLNLAFTPVQFGLRNLDLATIVIVLIWLTIIWSIIALWHYSQLAAFSYVPYLIWVSIASVLQITITIKNQ